MRILVGLILLILIACESKSVFQGSDSIYSPVMISPYLQAYTKCVRIGEFEKIREELDRARRVDQDFKVIQEKPEMIVVGYSENAAKYYFNSESSCQAYIDSLKAMGWQQK